MCEKHREQAREKKANWLARKAQREATTAAANSEEPKT